VLLDLGNYSVSEALAGHVDRQFFGFFHKFYIGQMGSLSIGEFLRFNKTVIENRVAEEYVGIRACRIVV
jgi:hypothetical protein